MSSSRIVRPESQASRVAVLLAATLLVIANGTAWSQGSLSTQGLGYPSGQASTRAGGTASAVAELDPLSQLNPAALGAAGNTTLFFQIEPEYRTVSFGATRERTTTARYPLFAATLPLGTRWAVGLSSATLLDRTYSTSSASTVVIEGEPVPHDFVSGSDGSVNDLRLGFAFTPRNWLRLGLGGHLVSGSDRVFSGLSFDPGGGFAGFADTTVLSFDGGAVSLGAQVIAPKLAIFSASFRKGGDLNSRRGDTALGKARVPDRLGLSMAYIGITGTQIAVRTEHDRWSSLNALGSGISRAVDAWDSSVGADIAGPRFGSALFMVRTGLRWRTLPYEADGNEVRERSASGGIGTTFAAGRVFTDLSVTRALRDANITVDGAKFTERAWTLSIGLGVRP